jgi:hypothetical protein
MTTTFKNSVTWLRGQTQEGKGKKEDVRYKIKAWIISSWNNSQWFPKFRARYGNPSTVGIKIPK